MCSLHPARVVQQAATYPRAGSVAEPVSTIAGLVKHRGIAQRTSHCLEIEPGAPGAANGDPIVNGLDNSLVASHWYLPDDAAFGIPSLQQLSC